MNFKKIKKLTVLSSVLLGTLGLSGSALAASSKSGILDNSIPVSGYVTLGYDSASASTSCSRTTCSVTATATYYYYDGMNGQEIKTPAKVGSGFMTATANAVSPTAPTRAVKGTGNHIAYNNGPTTWNVDTIVYP